MNETDDRLAGDPVWEMFPTPTPPAHRYLTWAVTAVVIAGAWFVYAPAAVVLACLAASFRDFRSGWLVSKAIPDKSGGRICALFSHGWGAWKLGATAFVLFFITAILEAVQNGPNKTFPMSALVGMLLWLGGFLVAAVLTANGLVWAYRSGMRVWIGEGINQARTLMLGMLLVGFTFGVLLPLTFLMSVAQPVTYDGARNGPLLVAAFIFFVFVAPVILLIILDWLSRRIVADKPGKFGPKVPTVGKWG